MKLADGLFLESCREVASQYTGIKYNEIIVDYCCMQLVSKPEQFGIMSDQPVREKIFLLLDAAQTSLGGASGRPMLVTISFSTGRFKCLKKWRLCVDMIELGVIVLSCGGINSSENTMIHNRFEE